MVFERKNIQKANFYLLLLVSFFIPFYKEITGLLIILWALSGLFLFRFQNLQQLKHNALFYPFSAYYILILFSLFFTGNVSETLIILEYKLVLIIFPLFFVLTHNPKLCENKNRILKTFANGTLLAIFFQLVAAIYRVLNESTDITFLVIKENFVYTELSILYHPAYSSMFALFSIVIILYLVFKEKQSKKQLLLIPVYIALIVLYSSKTGLFALLMFALLVIILLAFKYNKLKLAVGIFSFLLLVTPIILLNNERIKEFFTTHSFDINNTDPTKKIDARVYIWYYNIELIKENFWMGTTPGDYPEDILDIYTSSNYEKGIENNYNAHNQFLDSFAQLGILGFISLILPIIGGFVISVKERKFVAFSFLYLICINFLSESILNKQSGILFYAFFFSFLFFLEKRKNKVRINSEL